MIHDLTHVDLSESTHADNLISRSSSCAMAYLMVKKEMSAVDALTQFRRHRDVRPNDGFLEQIAELDNDLREVFNSPVYHLNLFQC